MKYFNKILAALLGISVVSVFAAPELSAVSHTAKPSQLKILSVSAVKAPGKNKVNVLVTFSKATTASKSPLLLTEIRVGEFLCIAKKSATKCTVKNIPSGKVLSVTARAKNKNGFGKFTSKIRYRATAGSSWVAVPSVGGTAPSVGGTAPSVGGTVPSVGGTVPSVGGTAPVTSYTPFVSSIDPAVDVNPATTLQFDLSGAVGLALKPTVSSSSVRKSSVRSNLVVVLESGLTREALVLGTASINKFIIAPNNRLYVLFNAATDFGTTNCLLAQVYRSTGRAVCLESSNISIDLSSKNSIQFDNSGNIFYAGIRNGSEVLRRFSNGVATDYVNQYQSFDNWLVLPNGDVIVSGYTSANGLSWTRRITPGNSVSSLSPSGTDFMLMFSDGNVYFNDNNCIKRYLVQQQLMDSISWAGIGCNGPMAHNLFLQSVFLRNFWITANARVMAQFSNTDLYFLYPAVEKANQPLRRITYGIPALTSMVLVGTNVNGTNQMVLFDSSTNTSSVLADGTNEIEFYRVQLNLAQNRIYFDGLRFSDNKYVIGYLDLSSRAILSSDVLARVQDFQTFVG